MKNQYNFTRYSIPIPNTRGIDRVECVVRDFSKYAGYELFDELVHQLAHEKVGDWSNSKQDKLEYHERNIRGIYGETFVGLDFISNEKYFTEWFKTLYLISPDKNTGSNANRDICKEWTGLEHDIEVKTCCASSYYIWISERLKPSTIIAIIYELEHRKRYAGLTFLPHNLDLLYDMYASDGRGAWKYELSNVPEFAIIQKFMNKLNVRSRASS